MQLLCSLWCAFMEGPGPSSRHRSLQDSLGGLESILLLFLHARRDLKASWGWDSVLCGWCRSAHFLAGPNSREFVRIVRIVRISLNDSACHLLSLRISGYSPGALTHPPTHTQVSIPGMCVDCTLHPGWSPLSSLSCHHTPTCPSGAPHVPPPSSVTCSFPSRTHPSSLLPALVCLMVGTCLVLCPAWEAYAYASAFTTWCCSPRAQGCCFPKSSVSP